MDALRPRRHVTLMTTGPDPAAAAERNRLRRRNTGIAMVFVTLLCVVAVVLAVNTLGEVGSRAEPGQAQDTPGAGGPTATPPPADGAAPPVEGAAPPVEGEAPPAEPPAAVTFSSPSGNIGCSVTPEIARCDIVDRVWEPGAPPAECTATWGVGVQVSPQGASLVCAADSVLGGQEPLAYGATSEVGTYRCTSTEAGMRCEDVATGRGFALARTDYTLF